MKIAISLPDPLFKEAERVARAQKLTRSGLVARALEQYLRQHDPDTVTEQLDRVLEAAPGLADPLLARAARDTLARTEWDP